MAHLEMMFFLEMLILIKGLLKNDSSLVATLATEDSLFNVKIQNDRQMMSYILDVFTLCVIHVIRGFRGHIINF